jgi:hypothetical protein
MLHGEMIDRRVRRAAARAKVFFFVVLEKNYFCIKNSKEPGFSRSRGAKPVAHMQHSIDRTTGY